MTHVPVLLHEAVAALDIKPQGVYVDGTMGGGGHSLAIAQRLTTGRLICIDKDDYAHARARERLAPVAQRVSFVKDDFCNLAAILDRLGLPAIDGLLLDLGVSSFQLDDAARGFSYTKEAPLDMRMHRSGPVTAGDIVNGRDERELADILFRYGEERHARRIAAAIVRHRQERPIETTTQLADIVAQAMPAAARREACLSMPSNSRYGPSPNTFSSSRYRYTLTTGLMLPPLRLRNSVRRSTSFHSPLLYRKRGKASRKFPLPSIRGAKNTIKSFRLGAERSDRRSAGRKRRRAWR